MINLAVVGSPPGNRFPYSEQMKTTERIVRLNDDWWLYEITTEDPVVLTRPFTVRYPMRNDPAYFMPEYACHENNTIVPSYVRDEPLRARECDADSRGACSRCRAKSPTRSRDAGSAGRESSRSTSTSSSSSSRSRTTTVVGKLIGTTLGRSASRCGKSASRSGCCVSSCRTGNRGCFAGELTDDGTIVGVLSSEQGGVPVTFRRRQSLVVH